MKRLGPINELTTSLYSSTLYKEDGITPLNGDDIDTMSLTFYDQKTDQLINRPAKQNVLNLNGVTIGTDGKLSWVLDREDNVIIDDALTYENHVALFEYTYASGERGGFHDVMIFVRNLYLRAEQPPVVVPLPEDLTLANFTLSSEWGDSASIGDITGSDNGGAFSVTPGGSGMSVRPTVSISFNAVLTRVVGVVVSRNGEIGADQMGVNLSWIVSLDHILLTFEGAPQSGEKYGFSFVRGW